MRLVFAIFFLFPMIDMMGQNVLIYKTWHSFPKGNEICYRIRNDGESSLWLWLSREDVSHKSDSLKVRDYLMKRYPPDMSSFVQIMWEGSANVIFTPVLFVTWVKVLRPDEEFLFYLDLENGVAIEEVFALVDARLNILPLEVIKEMCPGIEDESVVKAFSYPYSSLLLKWSEVRNGMQ